MPGATGAGEHGMSASPRAAASHAGQPDSPAQRVRHSEHVMGTVVSFDIPAWAAATEEAATGTTASAAEHGRAPRAEPPLGEAVRWLHWADRTFSTYAPDSDVSRLGRGEIALADCAPEVTEVLAACATLRAQTGGYFSAYPGGSLPPAGYVKGGAVVRAARVFSAPGCARPPGKGRWVLW